MTARPHDALFKAAFETPAHAAGLFRGALPPSVVAAIAWETITLVPGSFIDPDLADRQSDLLYAVELRGALSCCATSRSSPTTCSWNSFVPSWQSWPPRPREPP